MKRIEFITGVVIVGIIVFLEISAKRKKDKNNILYSRLKHEDVWWGN